MAWLATGCSTFGPAPDDATTVPHLEEIVQAVTSGSADDLVSLMQFSSLPCTVADGMGGPPKCMAQEAPGTVVEVLPVLGPEGHHLRRADMDSWPGIGPAELYAVFRTSRDTYEDEFFPAGDFGVVLVGPEGGVVVFQVAPEGIVRIDYEFGKSLEASLEGRDVILGPFPPEEG
jgi:hypothetical protein